MPPTPQRFCADCHADLRARLPDTRLADAARFRPRPSRVPAAVLIAGWNGEQPQLQRVAARPQRPRETSNLKFPHALHLIARGGVGQMARRLSGRLRLRRQPANARDCHVPTPDGTRFQPVDMEEDCGMCHSLAFDQLGGTIRTLRHG